MIEQLDEGDVAVVRLAHGKVNALDIELTRAIRDVFVRLEGSAHRAVVLTGTGTAFSAGVDLWRVVEGGADYVRSFLPSLVEAFEAVFDLGKPVVAAVNGHAVAGGCVLAGACDRRLMADGPGRIGVTELLAGVPFPLSALEILTFAVGGPRAADLVLTGATHLPREARAMGLVHELTAPGELLARAIAEATRLAETIPPATFRLTKRQLHRATDERIALGRPLSDPVITDRWADEETIGRIAAYMTAVTARR